MGNFIPFSATAGTNAYGVLYHRDTDSYYRPSTGAWVAWVSQSAHAVTATFIRASRYVLTIPILGADRLDIDARIYIRASGTEATTDTEIYQASFDWRGAASYPVSPYSPPMIATLSLVRDGANVALSSALGGVLPSDFTSLAGLVLTHPTYRAAWRVESYDDDTGVFVTTPIGHTTTLFSVVGATTEGWTLSRESFLPATAPAGYGGATSAVYYLSIMGAASPTKGMEFEARLYQNDDKNRVFFLRDGAGAAVAIPSGASVEVWDNAAKIGDATLTITDSARWSGTIAIPAAVWDDLEPGTYWLRALDGDDQIVSVTPLTVLDPAGVGTGW
jgi:hypothetical protein